MYELKNNLDGTIDTEKIENAIRDDNVHFPKTACISLENTHNICNGSPIDTEYLSKVFNLRSRTISSLKYIKQSNIFIFIYTIFDLVLIHQFFLPEFLLQQILHQNFYLFFVEIYQEYLFYSNQLQQ